MQNFNYLIRSYSWNKWIFEIKTIIVSLSYYQLLPMERYVAGNLKSALNERRTPSPSSHFAFISPLWVRKRESKRLNCLDRWPTVVLLLSTMATMNLSVNQGHGSPQHKLGGISVLSVGLTLLQIAFSCSAAFDTCKTALIYSNAKGNDF